MWYLLYGLMGVCVLLPRPLWAAWIQYNLSTMHVEGATESAPGEVPGMGITAVNGAASAIVWPVPAGCPIGSGQATWTHIDDVALVNAAGAGLSVRSDLHFFTTTSPLLPGCHRVNAWRDLKRLYELTIVTTMAEEDLVTAIASLNTWKTTRCVPGVDDGNANCVAWSTQLSIVNQRLPGRGQGITLTTDIATFITDVFNFKAAQNW